ncbi:MAG: hypothetical protein CVV13_02240 [Gammaproteobacteria bacterium HGW-Gammaproteobacteria-3]|nr:MAG: hypothetical protein CVV13_02240 [Gammaproteobacteria bacterium HGW-Gammaproteobacteria-3]
MKLTGKKQFAKASGVILGLSLASLALAEHPGTQPRPGPSAQSLSADGVTTTVITPEGHFPPQNPFDEPPGSNFLMTVYENARDFNGDEMPNTLPSTPDGRYNLHDGPVLTEAINKTNPSEDLDAVIDFFENSHNNAQSFFEKNNIGNYVRNRGVDKLMAQRGIDILEGNKIKDRAYSGFPMLHYNGPNKIKKVKPICQGRRCHDPLSPDDIVIGGNVDVEMIFWDQHIEADTAFIDPSDVQEVPWTITYHVNILHGGMEDFSPMVMYFDQTPEHTTGPFHVAMDQSYFPMLKEGTRYTVKIKESKGKYYNLTYTWGWRIHPPRVQVTENALKTTPDGTTLPQHEINVFGANPMGSQANKLAAIAKIGDLAPAKRMWNILRTLGNGVQLSKDEVSAQVAELRAAYLDWTDRTKLPAGVKADPNATLTLFYVNNTIYGSRMGLQGEGSELGSASFKGVSNASAHDWKIRPYNFKATLYNGDHFPHAYMNVDFGGSRGWENQFQFTDPTTALADHPHTEPVPIVGSRYTITEEVLDISPNPVKRDLLVDPATGESIVTIDKILPMNSGGPEEFLQASPRDPDINADPQLGSGCFFTFGRNHAWPNAGGPWGAIMVPPVAEDGTPGMHKVDITFNYEPSIRLRMYQFDPLHHDVAVYSLH